MNYLRILNIPVFAGLLVALAACPKDADQTTVAVNDDAETPSTTIVETEETPPADTNIHVDVDTTADEPVVVVSEDVRTKYPEVVTVVERVVTTPTVTDTVFVADSPAVKVWTTEVVPATAPADVVYRVRDFNVTNATDTVITADGYVLVASPSPDFTSERKYVTYTFQKDPTTSQWLINDLVVTRTEPATAEDLTIFTSTSTAGGSTDSGMGGGGADSSAGGSGDTGGSSGGNSGSGGGGY